MINEILKYEQRLLAAGLQSPKLEFHPKLKTNPKGTKDTGFLLVSMLNDGKIGTMTPMELEVHKTRRQYEFGSQNTALTFKFNGKLKQVNSGIENTIALANLICKDERLNSLKELANKLQKTVPQEFLEKIVAEYPEKSLYISFHLEEIGVNEDISGLSLMLQKTISDCLFEGDKVTSENLDALGSPNPLTEPFNCQVDKYHSFFVYSRNEDNNCYSRYGFNSHELCSFSAESRLRIVSLLTMMLKNKCEFKLKKGGSLLAIATLLVGDDASPENPMVDFKPFTEEEWHKYCGNIIAKIKKQRTGELIEILPGEILLLRKPDNGPINVAYKRSLSLDNLENAINEWDRGVNYFAGTRIPRGSCFDRRIPSIFGLTKLLSLRYAKRTQNRKSFYEVTKGKSSLWALKESYELFCGSESAYDKMTEIVSTYLLPVFVDCARDFVTPNSTSYGYTDPVKAPEIFSQYIYAVLGLILNKEKIMLQELESMPMFNLGRLFHQADRIHRGYCVSLGHLPPRELLGQIHLRMAFNQPQRALSDFYERFSKVHGPWAENSQINKGLNGEDLDYSFSFKTYREMASKVGIELPLNPSHIDKIALACGYSYRPFKETQNES